MNTPYDKNLELEPIGADQFDTHYGSSADSIYNIALQQLAIVKSADYKTKANLKALQAAKGNLLPSLGLGAGINTNYSSLATDALNNKISYGSQFRNNYGTYAGASINIPILNNFRYRYQVALAKIDVKNSRAQESTTKIQLKQNVEKDYLNMQAALDRYNSVVEQVVAYTESFRAAEIRFNQGVTSSVEYLLAKNKLDQARSNLIINRYEYLLRIKILDYYQAKPLW
jgi:outer membrane protein